MHHVDLFTASKGMIPRRPHFFEEWADLLLPMAQTLVRR